MCMLSILRLSPQWEQERLPLYLLLLIRGQHGQAVTQRPASGLAGGTQGDTAAGRLDAARSREATRPLALLRREDREWREQAERASVLCAGGWFDQRS